MYSYIISSPASILLRMSVFYEDRKINGSTYKQALQSKLLVTAKDGIGNALSTFICDSGCQPVHCTCVLCYYTVELYFLAPVAISDAKVWQLVSPTDCLLKFK